MNQFEQYKRLIKLGFALILVALLTGLYGVIWINWYNKIIWAPFFRRGNWMMIFIYGLLLIFFMQLYGGFKIALLKRGNLIYSQILAVVFTNIITYFQISVQDKKFTAPAPLVVNLIGAVVIILAWTMTFLWLYRGMFPPRELLLISGDHSDYHLIEKMNVLNTPFSDKLPLASLHWIISDSTQSITVESVIDGIKIYDNPVGVLTNNPSFDKQMFALNNYMYLSPKSPENKFSKELDLSLYSRGMGAIGLPGDLSSQSRFIRVAYTKLNSFSKEDEKSSVSQFFHILGSVDQQRGCCDLGDDKFEITIYTSCCNVNKGIYYYTTYDNHQITAVDMHKENLDSNVLIRYPLIKEEQIRTQN